MSGPAPAPHLALTVTPSTPLSAPAPAPAIPQSAKSPQQTDMQLPPLPELGPSSPLPVVPGMPFASPARTTSFAASIPRTPTPKLADVNILIPIALRSGKDGNQFIVDADEWAGELKEFNEAFTALGAECVKWHKTRLDNYREVIQGIHKNRKVGTLVVNLCDGYETTDGRPGNSVIKLLESLNLPFTGASSHFNTISSSKSAMKSLFLRHGVPTAPHLSVPSTAPISPDLWSHIPTRPMVCKPDGAYNSIGTAVVRTDDQTTECLTRMQRDYGRVVLEPFIPGREFTALVVDSICAGEPVVFPVMERVFNKHLKSEERFMSRDVWDNLRFEGEIATGEVGEVLAEVAKRAYKAVGGTGYGRVDIRLSTPLTPYVLEVNSLCGLSQDRSSTVGFMLHAAGLGIADVWREVVAHAMVRAEKRGEGKGEITTGETDEVVGERVQVGEGVEWVNVKGK